MKTLQIYLLVLLSALFAGCDTEGEFLDKSYYNPQVTFNPIELQGNYRITYNGSESPYVSKSEKTFKLEVFKKDDATNTPVLTENECPSDKVITLIQPIEKELAVYSESAYKLFTPLILFSSEASQYSILFNEYELANNVTSYLPTIEIPGRLSIIKNDDPETVLFSQELTMESASNFNLMQLSETEFMSVPEDIEPVPTEAAHCKVRFFYTDIFDANEISINVYKIETASWDFASVPEPTATITVKKGELSTYAIECDFADGLLVKYMYFFDVTDTKTGETLVDLLTNMGFLDNAVADETFTTTKYKKATLQIVPAEWAEGYYDVKVSEGLSEKW